MQKGKWLLAVVCALASGFGWAQVRTEAMVSSVTTVDDLVKLENAAVVARAKKDAITAGLVKEEPGERKGGEKPLPAEIRIEAVYGKPGALKANVFYNGMYQEGAQAGTRVGPLEIASIADRCVVFNSREGKGMKPRTECWTGAEQPQIVPVWSMGKGAAVPIAIPGGMPPPVPPMPSSAQQAPVR